MTEPLVTVDTIIDWLKSSVEKKQVIDAHTWVKAAQQLTVLLSDEHDLLFDLEEGLAKKRLEIIESGSPVSKAKAVIEADPMYTKRQKQKARIGRIEEMIRVAKIQARLKDNEYQSL